jgi:hypothetical protein
LTKHLYNNFKSIQRTNSKSIPSTLSSVALTEALISNPCAIAQSSEANMLLITLLHLIED